jgi:hypothetical protein
MMGFMICNLPEEYPYEISILEADFTPKDGSTIDLASVKNITELDVFPEKKDADVKDARIVIRATPDDANNVAATPEVAGMDQSGNFKGGKLHIKIDFGKYEAPTDDSSEVSNESTTDDSTTDDSSKSDKDDSSKSDSDASGSDSSSSKSDSSSKGGNGGGGGGKSGCGSAGTSTSSTGDGEAASDATENAESGAAAGVGLAIAALAGAAVVVSRKR